MKTLSKRKGDVFDVATFSSKAQIVIPKAAQEASGLYIEIKLNKARGLL